MKFKLWLILVLSTVVFIAACSRLPLAQPEQPAATLSPLSTATVDTTSVISSALEKYHLSKPLLLPTTQNETVINYLGWSADGSQLLAYISNQQTRQISSLIAFPTANLTIAASQPQSLNLDTTGLTLGSDTTVPLQLLGQRDLLVMMRQAGDNSYKLTVTDFAGETQIEVGQAISPIYAVSPDGWLAYIDSQEIVILDPEHPQTKTTLSLNLHKVNLNSEFFNLSLAPQGKQLVWHNELGQFQIITVATGQVISLTPALSGDGIVKSVWSPDGQKLAYVEATYNKPAYEGAIGGFREPQLAMVNVDGSNNRLVDYHQDSSGEQITTSEPAWDNEGNILAAIATPYKCSDFNGQCPYHIILIDSDNNQVDELFSESLITHPVIWHPNDKQLTFGCFLSGIRQGGQCVAEVLTQ